MSIDTKIITVAGIDITTVRKDIKNLHLGVYPPHGRVRIAAPLKHTDDSIRLFAISKLSWIRKQKELFINQKRQAERDYITGESHYFFGKRYLLNVIEDKKPQRVEIKGNMHLNLYVSTLSVKDNNKKLLDNWYRKELYNASIPFIEKYKDLLGIGHVDVRIKKMRTKWGTCNPEDKRIWLNLELVQKPVKCLEYVIAHEMAHFIEQNHNDHFFQIMDKIMPNWATIKNELNELSLGYETWCQQVP